MLLNSIELTNYRNYQDADLRFDDGISIFLGDNAQGKTNLLEAIHLLSTGQSHRFATDRDLIMWGESFYSVRGRVETQLAHHDISVSYSVENGKDVRIDDKKIRRSSELSDILNVIVFSPEDLQIVKGSPSARRRFIDADLVKIDKGYRHSFREYTKALQQRNFALRQENRFTVSQPDTPLSIWDEQLVEHGSKIVFTRIAAVQRLSRFAAEVYSRISAGRETLDVTYLPSFGVTDDGTLIATRESFSRSLDEKRRENLATGTTSVGPHRDDILVTINGKDIRSYGSQGQQRSAVLSLKLAMLELVASTIEDNPVLLLDDVMSELDEKRREYLLSVVSDRIQTFITTTSPDIGLNAFAGAQRFKISGGIVSRC